MTALTDWLNDIPLAGLMLVVALGFGLGRVTWRGIALGPAGGTILVALLLGREGLSFAGLYGGPDPRLTVGDFGFALFIYSVGFEAGPRFLGSLVGGTGWRFVMVAVSVNVVALVLAVAVSHWLGLGESLAAGLLSGALTSPPTYAAAEAVTSDPTGLALSFALTYPIGLAAVVVMVQFLPRLMGDDLARGLEEEDDHAEQRRMRERGAELTRAFEVTRDEVIGRTLRELDLTHRTGCYVTRLHRGDAVLAVDASTVLHQGDHLLTKGRLEELQTFAEVVGPEVYDEELRKRMPSARQIRVRNRAVVGRSLVELDLTRRFQCLVTLVDRGGHILEPSAELTLAPGDLVHVVGRRDDVRRVAELVGRFKRSTSETDIAVYAGGILLGLLIGRASVDVGGTALTLGAAGGLLLAGVLLGRFGNSGLLRAHVPRAARQLVRDLGILLFVAEAGVKAGQSSRLDGLTDQILPAVLGAILVTVVTVALSVFLARWLLRLRPVDAWGSLGGGMTSSAALTAIRRAADSNEPALSYATAYAVASVLATIAGQVVVLWMR